MIYTFYCEGCGVMYDIVQGVLEEHVHNCPDCGGPTVRRFTVPTVKKNEGFYSHTLGREVSSHEDFEQGLNQLRYETDQSKWLGDAAKPKDEWVERKETALQNRNKRIKDRMDNAQEK